MTEIRAPQLVVVPDLIVQVATGETCYPGENGFSAHWAEISTRDPVLEQRLSVLAGGENRVLLRCALLDVTGQITKVEKTKDGTRFVFSIDELFYRTPEIARNVANSALQRTRTAAFLPSKLYHPAVAVRAAEC